jgi:hypothetical protein
MNINCKWKFANPNTGLTDYLLSCPDHDEMLRNTNPALAERIISIAEKKETIPSCVFYNSNPGLTNYIMKCKKVEWSVISSNDNPKLAKFIYDNRHKLGSARCHLAKNRYIFKLKKIKLEQKSECALL